MSGARPSKVLAVLILMALAACAPKEDPAPAAGTPVDTVMARDTATAP